MRKIISKIPKRINKKKTEKGKQPYIPYYEKYSWFPTVISIIATIIGVTMAVIFMETMSIVLR